MTSDLTFFTCIQDPVDSPGRRIGGPGSPGILHSRVPAMARLPRKGQCCGSRLAIFNRIDSFIGRTSCARTGEVPCEWRRRPRPSRGVRNGADTTCTYDREGVYEEYELAVTIRNPGESQTNAHHHRDWLVFTMEVNPVCLLDL